MKCPLVFLPIFTASQLFHYQTVATGELPAPENPLHAGQIGYHLRTGGHGLTEYDWKCYMDFADRHWK